MLNPDDILNALRSVGESDGEHRLPAGSRYELQPISLQATQGWEVVYEEASGPGATPFRPPAFIRNEPHDPACLNGVGAGVIPSETNRVYSVRAATISGWRTVMTGDGGIFMGSPIATPQDLERCANRAKNGYEGCIFLEPAQQVMRLLRTKQRPALNLPGRGIFAGCLEPTNYGSFLFRLLPILLLLSEKEFDADYIIVPERTPWICRAVEMLRLSHLPVHAVRDVMGAYCESLLIPSDVDREGFFGALTLRRLRRFAAHCGMEAKIPFRNRPSKIYVSRRLAAARAPNYRVLVNEAEIEALAVTLGYTPIHPETLAFDNQVALFESATHVTGPSGSGMLNAAFSIEGTRVLDLESFHYTVRQHAKIYASTGKTYAFAFGKPILQTGRVPAMSNWSIDAASVLAAMERLDT